MKQFATTVILIREASQTLLILREDFRIWGLAGGTIEKVQLLPWGMPTLWRVRLWLRDLRYFLTGRR